MGDPPGGSDEPLFIIQRQNELSLRICLWIFGNETQIRHPSHAMIVDVTESFIRRRAKKIIVISFKRREQSFFPNYMHISIVVFTVKTIVSIVNSVSRRKIASADPVAPDKLRQSGSVTIPIFPTYKTTLIIHCHLSVRFTIVCTSNDDQQSPLINFHQLPRDAASRFFLFV